MKYDFIEIGTSDFDTEIQQCSNDTFGLTIEPISYYLNRLPCKPNVTKINAAVSNYIGECDVYYLDSDTIKKYNLPDYVKGQNAIGKPHPEVLKWNELSIDDITKEKVSVINFKYLIDTYNITSIDLLKVDTEGHDSIIINDYLDNINNYPTILAKKIIFESNILSDEIEVNNIIERCINLGYTLVSKSHDTILEL